MGALRTDWVGVGVALLVAALGLTLGAVGPAIGAKMPGGVGTVAWAALAGAVVGV